MEEVDKERDGLNIGGFERLDEFVGGVSGGWPIGRWRREQSVGIGGRGGEVGREGELSLDGG